MQPFDVREGDTMSWASGWWEAYQPIVDLRMGRTQLPTAGHWGCDGG